MLEAWEKASLPELTGKFGAELAEEMQFRVAEAIFVKLFRCAGELKTDADIEALWNKLARLVLPLPLAGQAVARLELHDALVGPLAEVKTVISAIVGKATDADVAAAAESLKKISQAKAAACDEKSQRLLQVWHIVLAGSKMLRAASARIQAHMSISAALKRLDTIVASCGMGSDEFSTGTAVDGLLQFDKEMEVGSVRERCPAKTMEAFFSVVDRVASVHAKLINSVVSDLNLESGSADALQRHVDGEEWANLQTQAQALGSLKLVVNGTTAEAAARRRLVSFIQLWRLAPLHMLVASSPCKDATTEMLENLAGFMSGCKPYLKQADSQEMADMHGILKKHGSNVDMEEVQLMLRRGKSLVDMSISTIVAERLADVVPAVYGHSSLWDNFVEEGTCGLSPEMVASHAPLYLKHMSAGKYKTTARVAASAAL